MNQKIYTDFGTLVLAAEYRHKFSHLQDGYLDKQETSVTVTPITIST